MNIKALGDEEEVSGVFILYYLNILNTHCAINSRIAICCEPVSCFGRVYIIAKIEI